MLLALMSLPVAVGKGIGRCFVGLLLCVVGIAKAVGWTMLYLPAWLIAIPSTVERLCESEGGNASNPQCAGVVFSGLVVAIHAIFFLLGCVSANRESISVEDRYWFTLFNTPISHYILIGLLSTNLLSLFYELGRKKTAPAKSKTDEAEKQDDGTSDFLTMFDSIRSFEAISPEQADQLYRRIIELLGEKKITPEESKKLWDIVHNGVRNNLT
ncbi:MAG: hypothetical protein G01um10143_768 [Parcubacteria group bacterium Gr01-1014_3]|nr:MAG: hypothetical protein G01um10143_768 [Parcubacteria group bacterium Gr01-1014_3]